LTSEPKERGRLDIRYRIAMPVEVRQGKSWTTLTTEDVSFGGMFLRASEPPKLRQLVRLRADLPFAVGRFEANAVVTRRIEPGQPAVAGVGLAFFAMGSVALEVWDHFILEAATACPTLAETPFHAEQVHVTPPPGMTKDEPRLEVHVASLEDLFVLHSRDASRAGIFLATQPDFTAGDRVTLRVLHVGSDNEFWIPCVVRQVRERGVAVEFAADRPELVRHFHDFLARLIDDAEARE